MKQFAIIETGGKQYKVSVGDKLKIEKIIGDAGSEISFDNILLTADGDSVNVGVPYVLGAKVGAKVIAQSREKKKIVFRFHSKTRYRKKKGHRQHMTEIEILRV
jgi:large subunit ribosomal protein L21